MELKEKNWKKFYNLLFWYIDGGNLPSSLCPLFWKTLIGIIVFPLGCLVGIMFKFFEFIHNNITSKIKPIKIIPDKVKNYIDKTTDKITDTLDEPKYKYLLLGIWVIVSVISLFILKSSNNLPSGLQFLLLLNAAFFIIVIIFVVGGGILGGFFWIINKLFKTKTATKFLFNVSMFIDMIFEKYCPLITWKK